MTAERVKKEFVDLANEVGVEKAIENLSVKHLAKALIVEELKQGKNVQAIARRYKKGSRYIYKVKKQLSA